MMTWHKVLMLGAQVTPTQPVPSNCIWNAFWFALYIGQKAALIKEACDVVLLVPFAKV